MIISFEIIVKIVFSIFLFSLLPIFISINYLIETFNDNFSSLFEKILSVITLLSSIMIIIFMVCFCVYYSNCQKNYKDAKLLYYNGVTNCSDIEIQKNLNIIIFTEQLKNKTNK